MDKDNKQPPKLDFDLFDPEKREAERQRRATMQAAQGKKKPQKQKKQTQPVKKAPTKKQGGGETAVEKDKQKNRHQAAKTPGKQPTEKIPKEEKQPKSPKPGKPPKPPKQPKQRAPKAGKVRLDPLPKERRPDMTPEQRKKRNRILRWVAIAGSAVLIVVLLLILCLTVFFRIDQTEVIGATRYSEEEILQASAIPERQNLFTLNEQEVEERVIASLPYVKEITISRHLPSKIIIEVVDRTVVGAVKHGNRYYVIGANGNILEEVNKLPKNCPLLVGIKLVDPVVGETVQLENEVQKEALDVFGSAMESGELEKITKLDLTDPYNNKATYDGRIVMAFGPLSDMDYKLRFAKQVLDSGKIKSDQKGTLDVSLAAELNKVYFNPDYTVGESGTSDTVEFLQSVTGFAPPEETTSSNSSSSSQEAETGSEESSSSESAEE